MKRLFKTLVGSLLAVLLCSLPAAAVVSDNEINELVRWGNVQGLTVHYNVVDDPADFQAYYSPLFDTLVLDVPKDMPDKAVKIVLLHEMNHAIQMRLDQLDGREQMDIELDADAGALNMACQLGMKHEDVLAAFEYMQAKYGYEGDMDHGSVAQRILYSLQHAPACYTVRPQAI